MPTFAEFYRALNGRAPFPWQDRLAEEVARNERWPAGGVGVPTGLGKTTCLDIAVWWLASQAHREPEARSAPTRIWWVVNRRLLVDSTATHAEQMNDALDRPASKERDEGAVEVLATVAKRLRSLSADPEAPPLDVIRLRGGVASRRPTDPSQPTILLCTLPMYGSRLLFRGYGSKLRSVDAAMAGTDSLVLLDEAHLAPHLQALLPALADCAPNAVAMLGKHRSTTRMVSLTATGDAGGEPPFALDEDDLSDPVVQARLDATKPLEVRTATGDTSKHLAGAARDLLRDAPAPAACVVFANTPKTARQTFDRLRRDADVLLLTGLCREREADEIRTRILDPVDGMAATRKEGLSRERHLIVVATQTLEVGADIDAEYLVTEACGVRALTQRLGRLNRLGRYAHARAVYVHLPPPKAKRGRRTGDAGSETWPVYGPEPKDVLERLNGAGATAGAVNLSPRRVAMVLGPPQDHPGRAPEVLPGLLWEWTKTTTPPDGEAPVEPYFSGIADPPYSVSLIWRVHVPEDGERLWPRAMDHEAIDVPIREVRDVLRDENVRRLTADGVTVEADSGSGLRPGDQVVLPTDRGLLDEFGWDPDASGPVVDVSLMRRGLPLDAKAIERLCGVALAGPVDTARGISNDDEDIPQTERNDAAEEILTALRAAPTPPGWNQDEWEEFAGSLTPQIAEPRREVSRLRAWNPARETDSDDLDERSLGRAAVELDRHGQAVATRARDVARRIGLPPDLAQVVERAGLVHDAGKADGRFQRWLDPDGERGVLVAKSHAPRHRWEAMRAAAGWPRGGRHEDLSARLVRAWLEQEPTWGDPLRRALLLHLVLSHHGKGRPLVPPVADGTAAIVSAVLEQVPVEAPADLAIIDWEQPARFRRLSEHFGPWGLALLEAVLIGADHAVSGGAEVTLEAPE